MFYEKGAPMSSSLSSEYLTDPVALDWDELSGLERIVTTYADGDHSVVLESTDGREVRITAARPGRRPVRQQYERRGVIRSGGQELRIWAQTPAYRRCTADDAASCVEAAALQVDRVNVY
jgi:hypothetical protein